VSQHEKGVFDDPIVMSVIVFIVIYFVYQAVYSSNEVAIHQVLVPINQYLLYPFAMTFDDAREVYLLAAKKPINEFTAEQVSALYHYSARYYRWFLVPIVLFLGFKLFRYSVTLHYREVLNTKKLLWQLSDEFPYMKNILDQELHLKPMNLGPWRAVEQAIFFAGNNGLLVDTNSQEPISYKQYKIFRKVGNKDILPNLRAKYDRSDIALDQEKTKDILIRQLGGAWQGFEALPRYKKGLAAAFLLFGCGNKDNKRKEKAYALIDRMATSGRGTNEKGIPLNLDTLDITGAEEAFSLLNEDPELKDEFDDFIGIHTAFENVFFMQLRKWALRRGRFETSMFYWMKPIDRHWYFSITQVGDNDPDSPQAGQRPYTEGMGSFVHYEAEKCLNRTIHSPEVELGVDALDNALSQGHWI